MTPKYEDVQLLSSAASNAGKILEVRGWHDDLSFVRIYKILSSLYGNDVEAMKHWIHTSNKHLGGRFPADLIQTENGIESVSNYLLSFTR